MGTDENTDESGKQEERKQYGDEFGFNSCLPAFLIKIFLFCPLDLCPIGVHLWPIPALGIGYGETKIIETYDFVKAIMDGSQVSPNFKDGYQINLIADAMAASAQSRSWTSVQLVK